MYRINKLSHQYDEVFQATIDNKTKPLGALGQLESLALQIAKVCFQQQNRQGNAITLDEFIPNITKPHLIVFAGDHGIAAEGVSIAPSEVTSQMVANFANGGAAINVFTRQLGWQLSVVDAGVLIEHQSKSSQELIVTKQRLGAITGAINHTQAMTLACVEQGFELAKALVVDKVNQGCNLLAFGEMGIGNTTIASALMSAIMNLPAAQTVGKGTGVSDDIVLKKQKMIEQALQLHQTKLTDPKMLLACLGGYEIVQITGAMLAAAEQQILIVVDGFICTAAAMVAMQINPAVKDYMIFAHCSGEQGHQAMLTWLQVTPLLDLGLRLGEGTGAALSLPLIEAATAFYNDMASFKQAAVTNVVE